MESDEIKRLFQDLVEISPLWDKLGVLLGSVEAPWVPTPYDVVSAVVNMLSIGYGDIVYDLGCGDGRFVVEAAKRGAKGVCVEIDKRLIEVAKNNAKMHGVDDKVVFISDDIVNADLSPATTIYMYLTTGVIEKLKSKIMNEVRPGTVIASLCYEVKWLDPLDIAEVYVNDRKYDVYIYLV
uniref:Methyltransferase domain-containing protein n=1 Tax=Ignisphaera aggregans TaxID=334771 RepID=A0A7C2VHJ9_9CREN